MMPRSSMRPLFAGIAAAVLASMAPARGEGAPPTYQCRGFGEPMQRSPQQIPRGRVLPLRAQLALPDGTFGDAKTVPSPPVLSLKFRPESGPEVDKSSGIEVRDYGKGNRFVFDEEAHWKFDLGTGNLPDDGPYVATLVSGDEKAYRVDPPCTLVFSLRGGK